MLITMKAFNDGQLVFLTNRMKNSVDGTIRASRLKTSIDAELILKNENHHWCAIGSYRLLRQETFAIESS